MLTGKIFWINFQFYHVKHYFGVMQDIPPNIVRYQREGTFLMEGLDPLVYIELDFIGDEDINEEVDTYDVRVTQGFSSYWKAKLKEVKEGDQGF